MAFAITKSNRLSDNQFVALSVSAPELYRTMIRLQAMIKFDDSVNEPKIVYEWLEKNTTGFYNFFCENHGRGGDIYRVLFEKDEDMISFKLTTGGQ